jgi:hypothetical protein
MFQSEDEAQDGGEVPVLGFQAGELRFYLFPGENLFTFQRVKERTLVPSQGAKIFLPSFQKVNWYNCLSPYINAQIHIFGVPCV